MRSLLRSFFVSSALAVLGAALASAQSASFDFTLLLTSNGNTVKVPNGQAVTLNTAVNTQSSIAVVAQYIGTTQATIATDPTTWLLGSTEFTLTLSTKPTLPIVLNPGDKLSFNITFAPTNANGASAELTIPYTEPGSNNTTISNSISLSLTGTSPSFTLAYALSNGNAIGISSGGTIQFKPPTQVNTTATATLAIYNSGSGQGGITGITLSTTSVFQLANTPLATPTAPYGLAAGQTLSIGVLYTPTAVENDTAQITINFLNGPTVTINLAGSGATSSYTYSYISGTAQPVPVKPTQTITFPPVTVATTGTTPNTSSVILTVKNSGNANGTINSVSATGSFEVSGLPPTPPTLKPGDTENFTITYLATQVGAQTGTLVVGSDSFILSGTGLGPQLTFYYGSSIPVGTGAVVFPSIAVSQSENVNFTITNSGTSNAVISLVSTNAPFSVPTFSPTTLAPGKSTTFPITFTPVTVGSVSGSLLVNSTSVPLVAAGTAPPALPSYTISGPSGDVSPVTQPAVSLTLSSSYPLDLNGVLTLTTEGSFGTDPAVQFAVGSSTGNRTVDFTIPANSTSANFAGQGSQILLQTGTVAETITLTPSFATSGGVNVTPAAPTTLQFTIPSSAPVLTVLQSTNETASGFTLVITGYTTPRNLNSLTVTFTPAAGYNLANSQFTQDLSPIATLWFQGSGSLSFGGLFQISMPFNLTGTVPTGKTLLDTIASVSATLTNSVGTSNSLQVSLP